MKKLKHSFLLIYKLYKRRRHRLSPSVQDELKKALITTQESILSGDPDKGARDLLLLKQLAQRYLPKTAFDRVRDWVGAIVFALVVAVIVRQMWFEFYEIPTGSMRPTFEEQDRLVVSKNQFGINLPLTTKHLYFDPALVERGGIVIFTGEDMDIQDVNTRYFYLFPGKKQYIKRLIGKPGDTVYFYGGLLYITAKDGSDASLEVEHASLRLIDHVPFISFEGKPHLPTSSSQGVFSPVVLYQMNQPVAKLSLSANHQVEGSMTPELHIKHYGDLWGFKNYAMARLLAKKDYFATLHGADIERLPPAEYYLELTHSPSLQTAKLQRDLYGRLRPMLGLSKSYIPLDRSHLQTLFYHLYTARFIVDKNGSVRRYGHAKGAYSTAFLPTLSDVPAGTYEFYYGKAYQVFWQGIRKELPLTHPIYTFTPEKIYMLFNLGIEFDTRFLPGSQYPLLQPSRYAFFREGSLYVMGAPLLQPGEPVLQNFIKQELMKQQLAPPHTPYIAFIDRGIPDDDTILNYGVKVPDGHYLVLGDNYAMSADSRDFGFVPANNLRGVPDWIFWPPGSRFGPPNQNPYSFFTLPRAIIWVLAFIVIGGSIWIQRKRHRLPLEIK